MSYTFLAEQGAESSAASFSDIPAYVLSRLNLTAERSCSNGSETASCPNSRSGTMCEPSTESHGEGLSMSSAVGSHARTSARRATAIESAPTVSDFGEKWPESLAKFDLRSRSWRTRQLSLFGGLGESLEIWPSWGFTRGGECWAQTPLVRPTDATEFGSWLPTPTRSDGNGGGRLQASETGYGANDSLRDYMSIVHGWLYVPVAIAEWLMAWPIGWTDLEPLGTDKFRTAWLLPGLRYAEGLNK